MIWATTLCSKTHDCSFKKERDPDTTPFCVGGQGWASQSEIFRPDYLLPWCFSFAFPASWPISVRYNSPSLFAVMEGGPDDFSFSFPVSSAFDTSGLFAGQRLNDAVIQRCLDSYNTSSRRIYNPLYFQVYEWSPVSSILKPLNPELQQLVFSTHHPHEKHCSLAIAELREKRIVLYNSL